MEELKALQDSTSDQQESEGRVLPFVENVSEATVACLITMVQGNVLALGLSHWLIASQTGIAAGTITVLALTFTQLKKRWVIALVLGVATTIVDFFVHPGMFGPVAAEAIVTGAGAAGLSLFAGWWLERRQRRSNPQ